MVWSPHREAPGHGVHHLPRVVSLCHDRFIRHTSPPPDSTAAHNRITATSQAARMHTVPPGQYNNTLSWRRQGMDIIIARNISKSVCVLRLAVNRQAATLYMQQIGRGRVSCGTTLTQRGSGAATRIGKRRTRPAHAFIKD